MVKISIKDKKPPLMINFEDITPQAEMVVYGSFKTKNPGPDTNEFFKAGRPK